MVKHGLIRVKISNLIPHERINQKYKQAHMEDFVRRRRQIKPIIVHRVRKDRYLILDGHHRVSALKELGYAYIIARRINYFSPRFRVRSWRSATKEWDKNEVIERALSGRLLRPKSTKHVVIDKGKEYPFSKHLLLAPTINYPIKRLK